MSQAANLRDTTAFEELEEADTFESVLDVIEARDEVRRRDASSIHRCCSEVRHDFTIALAHLPCMPLALRSL